ncbi:hypothetical protein ABPG74_017847 [Tetrahymena malaccensis]
MSSQLLKDHHFTLYQLKSSLNYTIIVSGQSGLWWIDNTSLTLISQTQLSIQNEQFISAVAITADSRYILADYENKLTLFQVNLTDFTLILQRQAYNNLSITDIYLAFDEKIAILIGERGSIIAYDIQSKSSNEQLQVLSSYNSQTSIISFIKLSQDQKWLFIADQFIGVTILNLNYVELTNGIIQTLQMNLCATVGGLYFVDQVEATADNKYLYAFDRWYGIQIVDLAPLILADSSTYPIKLNISKLFWPYEKLNPVFMGGKISSDSNFLAVSVRSQGLIFFDISDRLNPQYYYKIQIPGIPIWIEFTPSYSKIFYTDGKQILVFDQVRPNLNDNFPNLFNGHQSDLNTYSKNYYQWRCYISPDQKFMYATQCGQLDILTIQNNDPYNISPQITIPKEGNTRTCNLQFSSDFKYLYQPVNTSNRSIDIYDTSLLTINSKTVQPVSSFLNQSPQRNEDIRFSQDQKLLVITYAQGIQILDSTDLLNLKLLNDWQVPFHMNGFPCSVGISPNNKWVLIGMRNIGMYLILNIEDPKNPILENQMSTQGGEQVVISQLYNIAYLCDGSSGLAILDLSILPQINIISRISIDGWANDCNPIQSENYMLISSMDYGMTTLVNIQNKSNPIVYSKYIQDEEQSFGNCYFSDYSYGFSVSQFGLRVFPMKSQIKIHSSIVDISSNGSPVRLIQNELLQVGQVIELQLLMLYPAQGSQITDVFYYENYQMNQLPYWIAFVKSSSSVIITVDKSSIDPQNIQGIFLNTLVVQVSIPLTSQSFLYEGLTNQSQSKDIYNYYQQTGLIDGNNLITTVFNPNLQISFTVVQLATPELNQKLYKKVKLTLQRSIYYNPILFKTQQSLSFDINNQSEMISSFSPTAQLTISVSNPIMGVFVNIVYDGVISSMFVDQSGIIFSGSIQILNRILKNRILFSSNFPQQSNTVVDNGKSHQFVVQLEDGINYGIKKFISFQDSTSSFIHIKSRVIQNPSLKLQSQIRSKYYNSIIPIIDETSIEFSQQTFQDLDDFQLTYQAYLKNNDGEFIALKNDYWLKFQNQFLRFYGNAPQTMFNQEVTIQIQATNGFTVCSDQFTIYIYQLPIQYVLNLLVTILTTFISIIGIYRYYPIVYNFLNFKNTFYSKETASINQIYFKVILLLGDNFVKAQSLVNKLLLKLQEDLQNESIKNIELQQINNNLKQSQIFKLITFDYPVNQQQQQQQQLQQQQQEISQKYKYLLLTNKKFLKKQKKFIIKLNQVSEQNKQHSNIQGMLCDKQGVIDMDNVVSFIQMSKLEYKFKGKKINMMDDLKYLEDSSSILHLCVFCLLSKYILQQLPEQQLFYDYLKQYALYHNQYSPNDWYKNFIELQSVLNQEEYLQMSDLCQKRLFQLYRFKDFQIEQVFKSLRQSSNFKIIEKKFKFENVNLNILKQALISDALGMAKSRGFQKCQGESLHINISNIGSVQAYTKRSKKCIFDKSFFNFKKYGISQNIKLPCWMSIVNKHNFIILQGKPSIDDFEEFQIRITDTRNHILKTFELQIKLYQLNSNTNQASIFNEFINNKKCESQINNTTLLGCDQFQTENFVQRQDAVSMFSKIQKESKQIFIQDQDAVTSIEQFDNSHNTVYFSSIKKQKTLF